jgi:putative ABC transport system permease protein
VKRLSDVFLGPVRPIVFVLWVAVGVLLVVACANVANLLLLRASERSQEVAVRAALGVTRSRLARQLLTEAILLGAIGAAVGLIPAWAAIRLVATHGPEQIPRLAHAAFDARAAMVAVILAVAGGLLFGLMPLRQLVRGDFTAAVHGAGRRTASVATWRMRASLVIVNVAMAALLIVGSGLLVRSLFGLLAVSPGFDSANVLTMQVFAGGPAFRAGEPPQQIATTVRFYDEVLTRIRALPGVTAASAVTTLPLGGNVDGYGFHIEGRLHANPQEAPSADRFMVSPDFFKTMRIPLVRGRFLESSDTQTTEAVALINRTTAEELFPGEDPIGRRIMIGPADAQPRRIVGIVADVRHRGLEVPVRYQVYAPQAQWVWAETFMTLVIRSDRDPSALTGPVRDLMHRLDPAQPISNVRLYDDIVAGSTSARRFAANLLSVFAATTLLLAVIGLSGALGVVVGQRHREIGVRLALGARPGGIARMVLEQGLRPALIGVAIGLMAAVASVGMIRALLYQVDATGLSTYATSALFLIACAVVACLGPAIRASRIEPAAALRGE